VAHTRTAELSSHDQLKAMIIGTYLEMPGLSLTVPQAVRLFGIKARACHDVLDDLVRSGELRMPREGHYSLGWPSVPLDTAPANDQAVPSPSMLRACAVGTVAGVLGGLAMDTFVRLVNGMTYGHETRDAASGPHRVGRGMQPAQAEGRAEDDATVRLGSSAYEAVTGHEPERRRRLGLGSLVHYAFSTSAGVCYVMFAERMPVLRRGFGSLYGSLVWATADEGLVPALGLSRGPTQLTPSMHAYSLVGHWVYGATLELVRQLGRRGERNS
jgi:hypothetical protein